MVTKDPEAVQLTNMVAAISADVRYQAVITKEYQLTQQIATLQRELTIVQESLRDLIYEILVSPPNSQVLPE